MLRHLIASLLCVFVLYMACTPAHAQCEPRWLPGGAVGGINGTAYASVEWDPDGPGPLTPRIVVGGNFNAVSNLRTVGIAMCDPQTQEWSTLGSGLNGTVRALKVLADGRLIAAGSFTIPGGSGIAEWDGSNWIPFANATVSTGYALEFAANGDLVLGGIGVTAPGIAWNAIARWNGTQWLTLGSGIAGSVEALTTLPNGSIVAGGNFSAAGGNPAANVALWNGSAWSAMAEGSPGKWVIALATLSGGDIVMSSWNPEPLVASLKRWNGSAWSEFSTTNERVHMLTPLSGDQLLAGGYFSQIGSLQTRGIARWTGSAWASVGGGINLVYGGISGIVFDTLVLPGGDLIAVGNWSQIGGTWCYGIARWNGSAWSRMDVHPRAFNESVMVGALLPNGNLVVGGNFTMAGNVPANRIARSNGTIFEALGPGFNNYVRALLVLPNGNIVAGGEFTAASGQPGNYIARWNGSGWQAMGSGLNGIVRSLALMPNGDIIAGGEFPKSGTLQVNQIARWNGIAWSTLGTGMSGGSTTYPTVQSLLVLPTGDLLVTGDFTVAGGVTVNRIARWNGATWSSLGSGLNSRGSSLAVYPNGDIVVGGSFTSAGGISANRIARFNPNTGTWSPLGAGSSSSVSSLLVRPSGELFAGGSFFGPPSTFIGCWDGSAWQPLDSGTAGFVYDLIPLASNVVAAIGAFATAGDVVSPHIAYWSETNTPRFQTHPESKTVVVANATTLTCKIAEGFSDAPFHWQIETAPASGAFAMLANGPVLNAGGTSAQIQSTADSSSLILSHATTWLRNRKIRVLASNACGTTESNPAILTISGPCFGDINHDNLVNDSDFVLFCVAYDMFACSTPGMPIGCPSDLNRDNIVDDADFVLFGMAYDLLLCP